MRRQSSNNLESFRDFKVRHAKVARALYWLKCNNPYYSDIVIDNEILESLPDNESIVKDLSQIRTDNDEITINNENEENIICNFVPSLVPGIRENVAINNSLERIQNENPPVM